MKKVNKVKEIFVAAGYNYLGDNRSYFHKGLTKLVDTGLLTFKVCNKGQVWKPKEGNKYNVRVSIPAIKRDFMQYVGTSVDACDVLRVCGHVLKDERVKAIIPSYVDIDSTCQRCGGNGFIPAFNYYCDGICFECYGSGYSPKHRDIVEIKALSVS